MGCVVELGKKINTAKDSIVSTLKLLLLLLLLIS